MQKVIALSGYVNSDLLPADVNAKDYSKLDFYISHGTVDQVIPVTAAHKTTAFLDQLTIKYCFEEFPVGHGVTPQNFFEFKKWIEERM